MGRPPAPAMPSGGAGRLSEVDLKVYNAIKNSGKSGIWNLEFCCRSSLESLLGMGRFLLWGILLFMLMMSELNIGAAHEEISDEICNVKCSNEFIMDSLLEEQGEPLSHDKKNGLRLVKKLCQASNGELQIDRRLIFKKERLHQLLMGEGSHRRIATSINYQTQENATVLFSQYLCELILVERLTPGVFADPFELQRLVNNGAFSAAAVFGDTNLELPSAHSNQSVVEIHAKMHTSDGKEGNQIHVQVPLHARYPPLGETGFATVEIGAPDLIIQCRHRRSLDTCLLYSLNGAHDMDAIKWMIPRGIESHESFVSLVTASSALLCALVMVTASVYSLQMHEKRVSQF